MDVRTLMRQSVGFNPQATAIVTDDRSVTFEQAWDRGVRLANGLRDLGVRPGTGWPAWRTTISAPPISTSGCAIAGAVRVPLYPRNSPDAHADMLAGTAVQSGDCR